MQGAADAVPGTLVDGELVPDWLTTADVPWLRELLLVAAAFDGQPFAALRSRWRRGDVPPRAGARWRPVLAELQRMLLPRRHVRGTALRAQVFAAVAAGASRGEALSAGAAATGLAVAAVESALFADVGEQRMVCWPSNLDPDTLRRCTNGRFARDVLATANAAELTLHGASRAVLRTAWLHGTWFRFVSGDAQGAKLVWSAPPGDVGAGKRLAALVSVLPWARRFVLRAHCRWRSVRAPLVLSSLDALPVGVEPASYDSRWERELAAALLREFVGWEVVREPAPVPIGDRLAFPDFGLWRGGLAPSPWWVELAGMRDPAALAAKVALLQRAPQYVLCVPCEKCPSDLRGHARVVTFRRGKVAAAAPLVRGIVASV